jgi:hypothetical protein
MDVRTETSFREKTMRHLRAVSVALLGLSWACGASRSTPASGPTPASAGVAVEIDNQNFNDMTIYILRGGSRFLVGRAGGLSTTTLTIPGGVGADGRVRLLADPIGGDRTLTTSILIVPKGQRIFWTIGSDPANSSAYSG